MEKTSCGTRIELKQPSKSLAAPNGVAALFGVDASLGEKQFVSFALMVGFAGDNARPHFSARSPSTAQS
jgi:hypothetical protein